MATNADWAVAFKWQAASDFDMYRKLADTVLRGERRTDMTESDEPRSQHVGKQSI